MGLHTCLGLKVWLLVFGFFFAATDASLAFPIRVDFTGQIDFVDDPNGKLPDGINVGTPFFGIYTFDSIPPAGTPREVVPGLYSHGGSFSSFLVANVGGNNFSVLFTAFSIGNDLSLPGFGATADIWGTSFQFASGLRPGVGFRDTTLTRITDPTQYFVNTSLNGWTESLLSIYDSDTISGSGVMTLASGSISSLQFVPEPGTAILLGLGLAIIGSGRRDQGATQRSC